MEAKYRDKDIITKELRDELLKSLKQFASKRRYRQCKGAIDKLHNYELNSEDEKLVEEIEELLSERKYKKIVEMI